MTVGFPAVVGRLGLVLDKELGFCRTRRRTTDDDDETGLSPFEPPWFFEQETATELGFRFPFFCGFNNNFKSPQAPLNPSNYLCCRTCSHYSPGLFSGLREGMPPSVHQCFQTHGRCLPSGSSLNVNVLGGGAQHSPGRPPRQRRHAGSVAPGQEAQPTPSATNN